MAAHFGGYAHEPGEHHLKHFQDWEMKKAEKQMHEICQAELQACPNLEIKLVQGDAAAEILKMIQTENADLVVITTHGRGGLHVIDQKSPVFGSVAEKGR